MLQSVVNVRFDEDLKKQLDSICSELGMTVSSAITLFAKKVVREKRIPFSLSLENDATDSISDIGTALAEIEKLKNAMEAMEQKLGNTQTHSPNTQHKSMKLQTAFIFKDYMVIQRDKPFVIWGTGEAGQEVTVSIQGKTGKTKILPDGSWKAVLPALHTSGEELLSIFTPTESLTLQKVAVGEVWLAGGQSNMEFHMRYDADRDFELAHCENADIRFFDVPEISYPEQITDFDYSRFGYWRSCDAKNLEYFSAVGYYFAKKVQADLNVPIGIIGCNFGGSPSCAWMDEATVMNAGPVWLEEYKQATESLDVEAYTKAFRSNPMNDRSNPFGDPFGEMMLYPTTREFQLELMSKMPADFNKAIGPCDPWRPCGLFENMLKPLVPYGIRGFLWYQGESDEPHAQLYGSMLTALIHLWRELWQEQLPFLMVQLAPLEVWLDCHGTNYPVLRQMQAQVADSVPDVYMASIGDVGMRYDIHPKKKQPVGTRLALLALGHVYDRHITCDAPIAVEIKKIDVASDANDSASTATGDASTSESMASGRLAVTFRHAKALACKGQKINALQVFADEQLLEDFTAELAGPQLILSSERFCPAQNIRIAFARTDYYEVNLYNEAGIPVLPFELTLQAL